MDRVPGLFRNRFYGSKLGQEPVLGSGSGSSWQYIESTYNNTFKKYFCNYSKSALHMILCSIPCCHSTSSSWWVKNGYQALIGSYWTKSHAFRYHTVHSIMFIRNPQTWAHFHFSLTTKFKIEFFRNRTGNRPARYGSGSGSLGSRNRRVPGSSDPP